MDSRRVALFWLMVLAPVVLLTTRGRRLAPRVRMATAAAIGAGFASSILATVAFFLWWPVGDWNALVWFVFVGLPLVMAAAEAATASLVISSASGRGWRRLIGAYCGALIGHCTWVVLLMFAFSSQLSESLEIIAIIHAPAAVLGGTGAVVGAALVRPADS